MVKAQIDRFQLFQPKKTTKFFFSERRKYLKYFVNSNLDSRLFENQDLIKEHSNGNYVLLMEGAKCRTANTRNYDLG